VNRQREDGNENHQDGAGPGRRDGNHLKDRAAAKPQRVDRKSEAERRRSTGAAKSNRDLPISVGSDRKNGADQ
jgi:hypothetical protein